MTVIQFAPYLAHKQHGEMEKIIQKLEALAPVDQHIYIDPVSLVRFTGEEQERLERTLRAVREFKAKAIFAAAQHRSAQHEHD